MFRQPSRGVSQHRLRQQQAVGDHDHHDRRTSAARRSTRRLAQRRRLLDRQAVPQRALLDRARCELLAAAGGTIGLRVDGDDPMREAQQRFERRHGELRRAGEDDGQGASFRVRFGAERALPGPRSLRSFSSFLRMRVRLSSRQVVDEQLAVEMIHLVLDAHGEQAVGVELDLLAVAVERAHADLVGARDLVEDARHRQAAFLGLLDAARARGSPG